MQQQQPAPLRDLPHFAAMATVQARATKATVTSPISVALCKLDCGKS